MAQEPQKSNYVLIVIAIIGLVGTIVAATIGAIGNYNTEKLRQEAELTRIALVSPNLQLGVATSNLINIILTNNNCKALDYYVDGNLIFSPIEAGSMMTFSTTPGKHPNYSCLPNTTTCGEVRWNEWTSSTTHSIERTSDCP